VVTAPGGAYDWAEMNASGDVVFSTREGSLQVVRRAADGSPTRKISIEHPGPGFAALALSPDADWAAGADFEGGVLAWRTDGAGARSVLDTKLPQGAVSLAISADGAVAAGFADGSVRVWRQSGAAVEALHPTARLVSALAFSPDGRLLALAGEDEMVRVLELEGAGSVVELRLGAVGLGLEFTRDAALLVVAAADGVRVWDWRRRALYATWADSGVLRARISEDGRTVVSAGQLGAALHVCDVCGPVEDVLQLGSSRLTRGLTDGERRDFASGS
jgi:WD40 repeat protein